MPAALVCHLCLSGLCLLRVPDTRCVARLTRGHVGSSASLYGVRVRYAISLVDILHTSGIEISSRRATLLRRSIIAPWAAGSTSIQADLSGAAAAWTESTFFTPCELLLVKTRHTLHQVRVVRA